MISHLIIPMFIQYASAKKCHLGGLVNNTEVQNIPITAPVNNTIDQNSPTAEPTPGGSPPRPPANNTNCVNVLGVCDSKAVQYSSSNTENFDAITNMNTDHSVYNRPKIGGSQSVEVPWDGNPIPNSEVMDTAKSYNWFCPPQGGYVLRGLQALYEADPPFADKSKPTVAEIDYWNRRVVRHFRRMLGIDEATAPFGMEPCLSTSALWAHEYAETTKWGDHSAECKENSHCGWNFMPEESAQSSYLVHSPGKSTCGSESPSFAEGVLGVDPSINWSFILASTICGIISDEGTCVNCHLGGFIRNTVGGFSFSKSGSVRAEWSLEDKRPRPDLFTYDE